MRTGIGAATTATARTRAGRGMSKTAMPAHQPRPLLVAEAEPAEVVPTAHGLAVQMYRPARGTCSSFRRRVPRLTAQGRRCPAGHGCAA